MRSKDILNAMGKIDSRLIDEALETEAENISDKSALDLTEDEYYPESITEMKAAPKKIGVFKWAGLAAAVSAITAGAVLMSQLQHFNSINSSAASTGINISFTAHQTSEPMIIESETGVITSTPSLNSNNTPDNKIEILANGLPDVPLAQPEPSDRYFTAESLSYVNTGGTIPSFIADGRIYSTECRTIPDEEISTLTFLCYEPIKDELGEIFIDTFPEGDPVSYYFLCTYGDYIYFYRSASSEIVYAESSDAYPYTDIASYTLCRLSLSEGAMRGLTQVSLELIPYISDCVVVDQYMYFEEIAKTDDETKSHIYNISRLNLENGSISTCTENARCPLLYQDKLVFYRDGAFWQCELDGSDERVLFYDTVINFFKDRLCSDGNNIVLARNYTEYREDNNQYSAFTIEVYDGVSGFAPVALFTADVTSSEFFFNVRSAPTISCADGLFGFLNIIFDPETNTFVLVDQAGSSWPLSQAVMADGKIYCYNAFIDWSAAISDSVTKSNYYLLNKKE